jgi:hypothetical protein
MTICCLKESDKDCDGNDDTNLEIPELCEVLTAINLCRRYVSARGSSEKALNSLMSL